MYAICRARGAWASHRHSWGRPVVRAWGRYLQRKDPTFEERARFDNTPYRDTANNRLRILVSLAAPSASSIRILCEIGQESCLSAVLRLRQLHPRFVPSITRVRRLLRFGRR